MKHRKVLIDHEGSPADLHLVSEEVANGEQPVALAANHVRIRVQASTCTYTDILIMAGNYMPKFPFPLTPGYDAVGKIVQCGKDVKDFQVGDLVACLPQHGGCQDYLDWPASEVVKLDPTSDPIKTVTLLLTGITAYQMIHRVAFPANGPRKITENTKILIHSCAGGTGSMAVRLARIAGIPADNIYGTCSKEKFEYAKASGCGHPVDYKEGDWSESMRDVRFDCVLDAVGKEYYDKSLALLNSTGIYILYGFTSSSNPGSINMLPVVWQFTSMFCRNLFVSWIDGKSAVFYNIISLKEKHPEYYVEDLATLQHMLSSGQLEVPIGDVIPLEAVPDALQRIGQMKHQGKIIVAMEDKHSEKQ